jgi:hypothetical protein
VLRGLKISLAPGLEVCCFGHALRTHEAQSRPYGLTGFLEVVHRFFENGVFVGHECSMRVGILRSSDCFAFSRDHADWSLLRKSGRMKRL